MPKRKRKLSKAQLKALAKGRAKRRRILRNKKQKPKRRRKYTVTPITKRRKSAPRKNMAVSLTGGTGDVNPQLYTGHVLQSAPNQATTAAFISPVAKGIFAKAGKATVMEILRIYVQFGLFELSVSAIQLQRMREMYFSTKDLGTVDVPYDTPSIFAGINDQYQSAFTAAGTYGTQMTNSYEINLTDDNGHGLLVASDYIYVQFDTIGFVAAVTSYFKILYRFKNVSMREYVGIVQSQQ